MRSFDPLSSARVSDTAAEAAGASVSRKRRASAAGASHRALLVARTSCVERARPPAGRKASTRSPTCEPPFRFSRASVTARGTLFQTDLLWNRVDAVLPPELSEPPVQPLTLFAMEDLETALGHVPLGFRVPDLLAQKAAGPYRRREFVAFQHDVLQTPNTTRPPLLEQRFNEFGALLAARKASSPSLGYQQRQGGLASRTSRSHRPLVSPFARSRVNSPPSSMKRVQI